MYSVLWLVLSLATVRLWNSIFMALYVEEILGHRERVGKEKKGEFKKKKINKNTEQ